MALIDVGSLARFEEGRPTVIQIGGRSMMLVRDGEEVHAIKNVCPHQTQSFYGGRVEARVARGTGVPGWVSVDSDRLMFQCPWHQWGFDLRTGVCVVDDSYRVRRYATTVRDGHVFVET